MGLYWIKGQLPLLYKLNLWQINFNRHIHLKYSWPIKTVLQLLEAVSTLSYSVQSTAHYLTTNNQSQIWWPHGFIKCCKTSSSRYGLTYRFYIRIYRYMYNMIMYIALSFNKFTHAIWDVHRIKTSKKLERSNLQIRTLQWRLVTWI